MLAAIAEFDQWKTTRSFPDKDVAATLHLIAAKVLYHSGDATKAAKKCEEGLAYDPPDERSAAAVGGDEGRSCQHGRRANTSATAAPATSSPRAATC